MSLSVAPDLQGKRVLITGGMGFIGSNVAHRCIELGAQVAVFDVLDPKSGGNLFNIADIRDGSAHPIEVIINDIRNFEALCAAVLNRDIIFNCAAFTSHPNSMREPLIDIDVNCKGAINLLEAVRRFNPGAALVHVGTSTQIGTMVGEMIDEHHPEYPLDIYSANKTASEKYFLIYAHAYGLNAKVVRLANVFGPRSNIRSADFGFINYFIGLGLKGADIPVYGEGSQLRNFIYVDDAVDALIRAAACDTFRGQAVFATSDQHLSVAEVSQHIVDIIGGRVRYIPWPAERKAIEVGHARINNAKAKALLGWSPVVSIDDGLRRTQEYYVGRLEHYL